MSRLGTQKICYKWPKSPKPVYMLQNELVQTRRKFLGQLYDSNSFSKFPKFLRSREYNHKNCPDAQKFFKLISFPQRCFMIVNWAF